MAPRTAAASDSTRASALSAGAPVTTRQPVALAHSCHCGASPGSTSARTGAGSTAAAWKTRLVMPKAVANAFRQLLDLIGLFQARHRQDVRFVLLQFLLEILGELHDLGGILDILLAFGL